MYEYTKTGGARIGWSNATWPFATLKVNRNKLEINATILGNLVFSPQDIISLEPCGMIPIISQGIKITHRVKKYNSKVIFWTMGNPHNVITEIEKTGFLGNSSPISEDLQKEIQQTQSLGGFPIKTKAAIAIVVIWNLLFSIDFIKAFRHGLTGPPLGVGATLAIGFILITSILLLTSSQTRKMLLKDGQSIDNIKKFIYFIMFICVFMLINISAVV